VRRAEDQWNLRTARVLSSVVLVLSIIWVFFTSRSWLGWLWLPFELMIGFWIFRHTIDVRRAIKDAKEKRATEKGLRRRGFGPFND